MSWTVNAIDECRMKPFAGTSVLAEDVFAFLVRKSQATLFEVYRHSRKPIEAEMISAAAKYFMIFYMRESLLEFGSPRDVFVACMNLAAKTEEYHNVGLSDLVNALPDANHMKAIVPRIEMRILAAVDYDLVIEQPWQIMLFWVEMLRQEDGDDNGPHLKVYDSACEILRIWQWTDAVLVFPFPQLATAAVFKACINADAQIGSLVTETLRSPDDHESTLVSLIIRIAKTCVPNLDFQDLLERIEQVAYRFGAFERVLKDPALESRDSYRTLLAKIVECTAV